MGGRRTYTQPTVFYWIRNVTSGEWQWNENVLMSGHSKHLWAPTKMIELELVSPLLKMFTTSCHFYVHYVLCLLKHTRHSHETECKTISKTMPQKKMVWFTSKDRSCLKRIRVNTNELQIFMLVGNVGLVAFWSMPLRTRESPGPHFC